MGLFSKLFSSTPHQIIVPSIEEQRSAAKTSVDKFISQVYETFDKECEEPLRVEYFRIAGITYHCGTRDVGLVRGISFPHRWNPKDKTAIGLCKLGSNGEQKLIGYIAKEDKRRYKQFMEDAEQAPFIGYIKLFSMEGGESGICGMIKLYRGAGKNTYETMIKDTQTLTGVFKGYYLEQTFEEQGTKLDWVLERHF